MHECLVYLLIANMWFIAALFTVHWLLALCVGVLFLFGTVAAATIGYLTTPAQARKP